ncbi:hypothetical protein [Arthrobacter psychrochitiniphilus]|uniref:hypothetical protein n=1 Tax=Arthrobacter psychrochitiniphilus TaxID=291045 RepID=UPI003F7B8DDC
MKVTHGQENEANRQGAAHHQVISGGELRATRALEAITGPSHGEYTDYRGWLGLNGQLADRF